MQQHIYYTKYALQFADMQIPELVTVFNRQIIDVSAVYAGKAISFAHPVGYDIANNRLAIIG